MQKVLISVATELKDTCCWLWRRRQRNSFATTQMLCCLRALLHLLLVKLLLLLLPLQLDTNTYTTHTNIHKHTHKHTHSHLRLDPHTNPHRFRAAGSSKPLRAGISVKLKFAGLLVLLLCCALVTAAAATASPVSNEAHYCLGWAA